MTTTTLVSQTQSENSISVHTNKSHYITGDLLSYKMYLPNTLENLDKVIRVSFIDKNQNLLNECFLKTSKSKQLNGGFYIPLNLSSDIYHLVFSSYNKTNKEELTLAEVFVPIYSDLNDDLSKKPRSTSENNSRQAEGLLNITIELGKSTFARRGKNKTIINVTDQNGTAAVANLSVSIKNKSEDISGYTAIHTFNKIDALQFKDLSESIYFNGSIKTNLDGTHKKFPVVILYSVAENKFRYLQTDNDGKFSFTADDFNGSKQIQFVNYSDEQIDIEITQPSISKNPPQLIVTDEIIAHLASSRKRKKINQIFNLEDKVFETAQTKWTEETIEVSSLVVLDKYEKFENLSTFFSEVLKPLKFKKQENDNLIAQVFNREEAARGYYPGAPIFVIDGIITKDAKLVNDLDINMIESVNIVSDYRTLQTVYGPAGKSGIVYITTTIPEVRLPDYEMDDIFRLPGFQSIELTENNSDGTMEKTTPYFSNNILWLDNLKTDNTGQTEFQFTHTDDLGEFEIEVVARSEDGHISRSTMIYNVVK